MKLNRNTFLFSGLLFHILAAIFSVGHHQCDELFQVYEFAGYKLGINKAADLPWEFSEQMRSGIEPYLIYITTKTFHLLGIANPFHISMFLRLFMSLLAFGALWGLIRQIEKQLESEKAKLWLWAGSFLFWCIPYFHARLSSENVSATVFIFGLNQSLTFVNHPHKRIHLFVAGILFALAFVCRFQTGFMVAGTIAWLFFIYKVQLKSLTVLLPGVLLGLGLGLLADKWMYGGWVLSWWNYLDQNIFQSRASAFGVMPFYYFITEGFLQMIPPFSLLVMICMVGFWARFRSHVITWITFPFVALHFFVGHKELRFLFPVLNFIPAMMVFFIYSFSEEQTWRRFLKNPGVLTTSVVINSLLLLFMSIKPADEGIELRRRIYHNIAGNSPLLIYLENDPYNPLSGLNYFKNPAIKTISLDSVVSTDGHDRVYLFADKKINNIMLPNNKPAELRALFSAYPEWVIRYFDFNGWVERSGSYTMYELYPVKSKTP